MVKRLTGCLLCLVLMMIGGTVAASAQTEVPLLLEEQTAVSTGDGEIVYTDTGALQLTSSSEEGVSAAIAVNQTVNIFTVKYVCLSVQTTAPFNVALKMTGTSYDIFPQTTGPSWYEAFQKTAPSDGQGITAGSYTVALDIHNYVEYNGLEVSQDGFVTLKTVYLSLRGAGSMLVHHLTLSDTAQFTDVNGQVGVAATTMVPITTDTKAPPASTEPTLSYAAHGTDSEVYANNVFPTEVIVACVAAAVLVAAMILLTLLKKRKSKETPEE